jgi:hypothetical protein
MGRGISCSFVKDKEHDRSRSGDRWICRDHRNIRCDQVRWNLKVNGKLLGII